MTVTNQTDRAIGPLQVSMSQDDEQGVSRAIVVNGLWSMVSLYLELIVVFGICLIVVPVVIVSICPA